MSEPIKYRARKPGRTTTINIRTSPEKKEHLRNLAHVAGYKSLGAWLLHLAKCAHIATQ